MVAPVGAGSCPDIPFSEFFSFSALNTSFISHAVPISAILSAVVCLFLGQALRRCLEANRFCAELPELLLFARSFVRKVSNSPMLQSERDVSTVKLACQRISPLCLFPAPTVYHRSSPWNSHAINCIVGAACTCRISRMQLISPLIHVAAHWNHLPRFAVKESPANCKIMLSFAPLFSNCIN